MDAGTVLELDAAEESLNTSEGEASLKRRERERDATKSSEMRGEVKKHKRKKRTHLDFGLHISIRNQPSASVMGYINKVTL
jgi:hypothetical protein